MYRDQRATVSADYVTIDGDTVALSAVIGARVERRSSTSAWSWAVAALIFIAGACSRGAAANMKPNDAELPNLIGGLLMFLGAVFAVAVLASRSQRENGIVLMTTGGEMKIGKPGSEQWATGVAQAVLAAVHARSTR
jgi:hypothetical protein